MIRHLYRTLAVLAGTSLVGVLAATPAWAGDLSPHRRGVGIGSALLLLCCLVVTALVAIGVVIGMLVGRRRRR